MEIPNLGRSRRFLHTDQAAPIKTLAANPLPRFLSAAQNRSEKRSAPRPGSATRGDRRSEYETTTQAAKPPL
jgi:hypothetical protein